MKQFAGKIAMSDIAIVLALIVIAYTSVCAVTTL